MSGSHTRTYSLPHGYSVEFNYSPAKSLEARWSPDAPRIRKARQRQKFFEAYKSARREFLREVAAVVGRNVLIVDTDAQTTTEVVYAPTRH
jgi:hypothetical protein